MTILSEIAEDESGWWIELHAWGLEENGITSLDDCALGSEAGIAAFNPGISPESIHPVVDQSDLQSQFIIDWSGDAVCFLRFAGQDTLALQCCEFGEGCWVQAPLPWQSLFSYFFASPWCKSDCPTPGEENWDCTFGTLEGFVLDSLGFGTPGYWVAGADPLGTLEFHTTTDDQGRYSVEVCSRVHEIWATSYPWGGEETAHVVIQTEPDSTYQADFVQGTVGVEGGTPATPAGRALLSNYPNPFNPETRIRWRLPPGFTASAVLRVFNLLGEELRAFWIPAGRREGELRWDGRDTRGKDVPGGIYLTQLESEGRPMAVDRMLLLR